MKGINDVRRVETVSWLQSIADVIGQSVVTLGPITTLRTPASSSSAAAAAGNRYRRQYQRSDVTDERQREKEEEREDASRCGRSATQVLQRRAVS